MCTKCGPQLANPDEELFRQVRELDDDDAPGRRHFKPRANRDGGHLSVDRGGRTSAAESYKLFTSPKPQGFEAKSVGVWAVTVGEAAAIELAAWEKPTAAGESTPENLAHATIDMSHLTDEDELRVATEHLLRCAVKRGRQHPKG